MFVIINYHSSFWNIATHIYTLVLLISAIEFFYIYDN